jgi:hypothetical protein
VAGADRCRRRSTPLRGGRLVFQVSAVRTALHSRVDSSLRARPPVTRARQSLMRPVVVAGRRRAAPSRADSLGRSGRADRDRVASAPARTVRLPSHQRHPHPTPRPSASAASTPDEPPSSRRQRRCQLLRSRVAGNRTQTGLRTSSPRSRFSALSSATTTTRHRCKRCVAGCSSAPTPDTTYGTTCRAETLRVPPNGVRLRQLRENQIGRAICDTTTFGRPMDHP